MKLENKSIILRALEPEDLEYVYEIENNTDFWEISHTQTPYSRFLIKQYLENAHQDIYEAKQLRLVIETKEGKKAIGLIDLFEFDPKNQRVGMGILISDSQERQKGYATEAVETLIQFTFKHLQCHQIFVNIDPDNTASCKLFSNFGFECIGIKKEWNKFENTRKDEALFQLINKI